MAEQQTRQYNEQSMQVVAIHPKTGEKVVVMTSKYENQYSAVSGALARLGITFTLEPYVAQQR